MSLQFTIEPGTGAEAAETDAVGEIRGFLTWADKEIPQPDPGRFSWLAPGEEFRMAIPTAIHALYDDDGRVAAIKADMPVGGTLRGPLFWAPAGPIGASDARPTPVSVPVWMAFWLTPFAIWIISHANRPSQLAGLALVACLLYWGYIVAYIIGRTIHRREVRASLAAGVLRLRPASLAAASQDGEKAEGSG